ncbi:hypothetical protein [Sinorhizobium meliloti]|uniref:hypothetical protein n=1 Tax=Rhizobium meliloti TaxID=382 RepID=UPI0013E34A93|nr:hypothetical protein [Sinorhizobium meliloti]
MKRNVRAMRLLALAAILIAVLLLFLLVSGFADVPCQDGTWDPNRYTCGTYRGDVMKAAPRHSRML